ncbi:hypothetical protein Mapa_008941 [Marchantia paleacea]|nr:hypothetical protein Mapa_008941 [Marchantia paleacea]
MQNSLWRPAIQLVSQSVSQCLVYGCTQVLLRSALRDLFCRFVLAHNLQHRSLFSVAPARQAPSTTRQNPGASTLRDAPCGSCRCANVQIETTGRGRV